MREFHLTIALPGGIKSSRIVIAEQALADVISSINVYEAIRIQMHHRIVAYLPRNMLLGHVSNIDVTGDLNQMYLISNPTYYGKNNPNTI